MKALLSAILILSALSLQNCAVGGGITDTKTYTITHEHQVKLPATLYSPGATTLPQFEKKGDIYLAGSVTNSGNNQNNDTNPDGNTAVPTDGASYQTISKTKTFSAQGGYALNNKIGLIGSVNFGKEHESYRPYIESWNITEDEYTIDYWIGIPLDWDEWVEGEWQSTTSLQTINEYKKVSKNLTRSYSYFDADLAVGQYLSKGSLKTGLYGGVGLARNRFEGHLDRGSYEAAYARHDATFFKVFALPSIAFSTQWVEFGAAMKCNYLNMHLKSAGSGDRRYESERSHVLVTEPSMFISIGPRYFRVILEQKFLAPIGDTPFPYNRSLTSVGVSSTLNTGNFKKKNQ